METKRPFAVSVVMAVYRAKTEHLVAQIESILSQLGQEDELLFQIDFGDDTSYAVIAPYLAFPRVRCLDRPSQRLGVCNNFEQLLSHTTKEILFLCDQDDVWAPDKIDTVLSTFAQQSEVVLVCHDATVTDADLQVVAPSFFAMREIKQGIFANFIRNSYMGCCMAFRRSLLPYILPFPKSLPMHDQWIALCAQQVGSALFLQRPLLFWRRHGANTSSTKHSGFFKMLSFRLHLLWAWMRHRPPKGALRKKKNCKEEKSS